MYGIKVKRDDKGWTQEELAKALEVSVRTIRNWESGAAHPGKRLGDVARVLDTTEVAIMQASILEPAAEEVAADV